MSRRCFAFWLILFAQCASAALAAAPTPPAANHGPALGEPMVLRYRVGIVVTAANGPCQGIVATTPMPVDWREQQVKIIEDDLSPSVHDIQYRELEGGVKQMVLSIPYLAAGEECHAITTIEVTRHSLISPDETSELQIPKKLPKDIRAYLGTSPGIETRSPKIRSISKEIIKGADGDAWSQVEAIYDWVRDNVKYREGDFKGALSALRAKEGDCEELSSLFIAMCRNNGIPARTVWVPGHCYPEFYLADASGAGYWFPCQAAGTRDFGGIPEHRPILQKGDDFVDPDRPSRKLRYVTEHVTGKGGKPRVRFVREMIGG